MSHFGENQFPEFKLQSLAEACAGAQRPLLAGPGDTPAAGPGRCGANEPTNKILIIIVSHS